ncbi:FG-GAP repeat domain-containing protein [Microbacterium sp. P01]|uniref:FG-GAP repeat domain-containing protein n=1 Tax=Microbacterium sp. P01 TaxID=3366261 RepID=UPI00366AD4E7
MTRIDMSGDGRSDLMVTSPWGLGVVGWDGGGLAATSMSQNGSRIGEWLLDTSVNRVQLVGDFDADGRHEALMSSPWGIGVAAFAGGATTTRAMAQNGTRLGGWIVDTSHNRFLHAADADGDGRAEVVVTSPWGIGLLGLRGGALTSLTLAPNGTRLGEWLLNTGDNWIPAVGDLNGDGRAELVITSPWGLGILRFDGTSFVSIVMAPNGTVFGSWTLNTATDRVEAVADLDGDGQAELVISGPPGLVVLGLSGATLAQKAFVADGASAGAWTVDAAHNAFVGDGDVDGDGKHELIVTSDWGIGVLALRDGALTSLLAQANGSRLGGWNLNTRDNRFGPAMDVDGDGRDELVVTSPWGIGILRLAGAAGDALMLAPNGTRFGGWSLNTADNDWLSGHAHAWGVFLHHPQWGGAVAQTEQVLATRGYAILDTNTASVGIELINRLARVVRPADRVFVYLAGHGAAGRSSTGDHTTASAFFHYIEFESGGLRLTDIAPAFSLMGDKSVDLAVFDGSCDGGETVIAATGERYLAVATTGVYAPGLTDTPSPGNVLQKFGQPNTYGMWWSRSDTVSMMTGEAPHRFYQKMYRNDDTEIARWSLFYKTAINFYPAVAGSWDLVTRNCYLFEYVFAELFNDPAPIDEVKNFKAAAKIGLTDYLTSMQADYDGFAPTVTALRNILANGALVDRAADVYASAFPRAWQTTTGLFDWNVDTSPAKLVDGDTVWLVPSAFPGADGFRLLVAECLRRIADLEVSWGTQKQRLIELDRKVARDRFFEKIVNIDSIRMSATLNEQLRKGEFDRFTDIRTATLVSQLRAVEPVEVVPQLEVEIDSPLKGLVGLKRRALLEGHARRLVPEGIVANKAAARAIDDALKVEKLDTSLVSSVFRESMTDIFTKMFPDRSVAEIVADIRATETTQWVSLGQLHYYLTIVEEAVSKVSETGAQRGGLTAF